MPKLSLSAKLVLPQEIFIDTDILDELNTKKAVVKGYTVIDDYGWAIEAAYNINNEERDIACGRVDMPSIAYACLIILKKYCAENYPNITMLIDSPPDNGGVMEIIPDSIEAVLV